MTLSVLLRALSFAAFVGALAGCASDRALREGERLIAAGETEAGLRQLEQAMQTHPGELRYRTAYIRQRDLEVARLLMLADGALRDGDPVGARARYQQALQLHPHNPRASEGLAAIEISQRNQALLAQAQDAARRNDNEGARAHLRAILVQTPGHTQAQRLLRELEQRDTRVVVGIDSMQLGEEYRRPVTLEFRDAPLRSVFEALSRQSGINFVFDKDLRTDQRATLYARNTPIADALDMLLTTSGLARKVLNSKTLLIYPNLPAKQREYQEMAVRSFFLANADAKQVMTLLKTIAKVRDVYVDEKLNMVMVRDTPESLRVAERLVHLADRQEPEVMLEVEILEVKRNKLMELGVQWPTQLGVPNITKTPLLAPNAQGVQVPTGETVDTLSNLPLNVRRLRQLGWGDLTVMPSPTINLRKDDSDVNLLANPRIRVRNKEKAKIHIGDKVPVITSNVTSTGVTSESVSYLDVGLKLDVEPQVHLDGDVAMKVGLEVSNIVREVKSSTGTLTYQLGSRNASTVLRLRDGETQVLAGLISDEERAGASKVPGLGDLPLIGRLFSSHRDEKSKTEIVLLITPRILREVARPELAESEFLAGTEMSLSLQPLRITPPAAAPAPAGRPAPVGRAMRPPVPPGGVVPPEAGNDAGALPGLPEPPPRELPSEATPPDAFDPNLQPAQP